MNDFMNKLKTTKILGIIGNALILIGVFLPMIDSILGSYSLLALEDLGRKLGGQGLGFGIVLIIIAIFNFIIIFSDKIIAAVPSIPALEKLRNQKLTVGTTVVVAVLFFMSVSKFFGLVTFSFGFYVLILGIILSIVYPFLYKGDENK